METCHFSFYLLYCDHFHENAFAVEHLDFCAHFVAIIIFSRLDFHFSLSFSHSHLLSLFSLINFKLIIIIVHIRLLMRHNSKVIRWYLWVQVITIFHLENFSFHFSCFHHICVMVWVLFSAHFSAVESVRLLFIARFSLAQPQCSHIPIFQFAISLLLATCQCTDCFNKLPPSSTVERFIFIRLVSIHHKKTTKKTHTHTVEIIFQSVQSDKSNGVINNNFVVVKL